MAAVTAGVLTVPGGREPRVIAPRGAPSPAQENTGSFPFQIDRMRARADVGFTEKIGLIAEWNRDEYDDADQQPPGLGAYEANRYAIFLRWRQ